MRSLTLTVPALAVTLSLVFCAGAFCADNHDGTVDTPGGGVSGYIGNFLSDTASIAVSPLEWDSSGWTGAALVVGVTATLYACDGEIRDIARSNRTTTGDEISGVFRTLGDKYVVLSSLGAALVIGNVTEDARLKKTALVGLESFLITSIFTETIKMSTHRHRPGEDNEQDEWDGPGADRSGSRMSFPSGHAASAFSIASVVASTYGDRPYVSATAYTLATLAALSRINDDEHWASDVFFGSALGYFTGKAVIKLSNKRESGLRVLPVPMEDGGMVVLSYSF